MNKSAVWGLSVLILLCCSSLVLADENFNLAGPSSISALRCVQTAYTFSLVNTGDVASTYTLELSGSAASWVSVPGGYTLQPGAVVKVPYTLDTPCDALGTYDLIFTVTTDSGIEDVLTQDVTVDIPNNIDLSTKTTDRSVTPCQTAEYTATLANPGPFDETYALSVLNPSALDLKVVVSPDTNLNLDSNASKAITIDVTPRDCMQSGKATLTLQAKTKTTELTGDLDLTLDVANDGIASVGNTVDRIVSGYEPSIGTVDITNKGDSSATYTLTLNGPPWVSAPPTITVAAGKTERINLTLTPDTSVPQGDYHLGVVASIAGAEYSKNIVLRVYEPSWIMRQLTEHFWRTVLIVIAAIIVLFIILILISAIYRHYTSEEYQEKKRQRAEERAKARAEQERLRAQEETQRKKDLDLAARQKEKLEKKKAADEERARLKKAREEERARQKAENERKRAQAKIDKELARKKREEERRASAEYFASATLAAERELRKNNIIVPKKELERAGGSLTWLWIVILLVVLAAIGIAVWQLPWLWTTYSFFIVLGLLVAIALIIILIVVEAVRRGHTRVFRYKLLKDGDHELNTGWPTFGSLHFSSANVLVKCALRLRRSATPTGFVAPETPVYDYLNIDSKAIDQEDLDDMQIRFAVPKRWLSSHNMTPDKIRLAQLTDNWRTSVPEIVGEDKKNVYYSADIGFGNYCITGKPGKAKPPVPLPWAWIAVVLILVVVIGGAYVLSLFATPQIVPAVVPDGKGIPPQYWAENTQHMLNISKAFYSPDNYTLSYTYTPVDDVVVTVNGGIATLVPAKDFIGERTVQFTATDSKGGKAKSNEIRLVVYEPPAKTFLSASGDFTRDYFLYIVVIAVIVILVILSIEYKEPLKRFLEED